MFEKFLCIAAEVATIAGAIATIIGVVMTAMRK